MLQASWSSAAPDACIGSPPPASRVTVSAVNGIPSAWPPVITRPSAFSVTRPPNAASNAAASKTATVRMSVANVTGSVPAPRQYTASLPACRARVSRW